MQKGVMKEMEEKYTGEKFGRKEGEKAYDGVGEREKGGVGPRKRRGVDADSPTVGPAVSDTQSHSTAQGPVLAFAASLLSSVPKLLSDQWTPALSPAKPPRPTFKIKNLEILIRNILSLTISAEL